MTELFDDDDLFAVRKPVEKPDSPVADWVEPRVAAAPAAPKARPVQWIDNPGKVPDEAKGKRVVVELANGRICGVEPVTTVTPAGWAADGPNGCRWSIRGEDWDIRRFRIL